ncbi:MAG: serine hydrolase [Bacteroidota bacterium]
MKKKLHVYILMTLFLAMSAGVFAQKESTEEFDKILSSEFKSDGPGCAALVVKDGKVVYRKAFGKANIELNVNMESGMIFRLGSITKQFTAVAILKLMEEGKLSLQDEITKFIPDYPTHGYKITVEHLLTHTSGIKSYTDMKEWTEEIQKKDMTPKELIDLFKDQPMNFEPGAKFLYNNSGYILLGYIIEKVSGESYAAYMEKNIFKPLGLVHTSYDNPSDIIKTRVPGYSKADTGFANAAYLSMTQPYAAGSLLSTVDDLYTWTKGVRSGKLIRPETFEKAVTSCKLNDGTKIGYGYGLGIGEISGSVTISHGGGINGFLTISIYMPKEDVFVGILSNCDGLSPENAAFKMAAITSGKLPVVKEISLDTLTLKKYVGVFESENGEQRVISYRLGKLYSIRTGGTEYELTPYDQNKFFFNDAMAYYEFARDKDGKVYAVNFDRIGSTSSVWKKTEKTAPLHTQISLPAEQLQKFTGVYELAPTFTITVSLEDGHLIAQPTGQPKFEIFAETPNKFFLKVVDAQIEFIAGPDGSITKLILHQNGEHEGKKVK